MQCLSCHQERTISARGLCRTCYSRWQRGGQVEAIQPLAPKACSVEGCTNRVHGQGLCNKHLLRLRRTGTVGQGRVYTHKERDPATFVTTHDLYPTWAEFSRKDSPRNVVPEWRDNFETFVAQVAPRPGRRYKIHQRDKTRPIGPDNYEWRETLIEKTPGEDPKEYARRLRKAHKEAYPEGYKNNELKRRYGEDFTFDAYADMADAQGHKCVICGNPETEIVQGKVKQLAVDHDHATGKVRELLCQACNKMLGHAKDDPIILARAIAYLAKHKDAS